MTHEWRTTLKKLPVIAIFCLLLVAGCISGLVHVDTAWVLLLLVPVCASFHRFLRVSALIGRLGWLAYVPWTYEKPLPFETPLLEKRDVLQLGVLALTALLLWGVYLQPSSCTLQGTSFGVYPGFLFHPAMPLAVYFFLDSLLMLALLEGMGKSSCVYLSVVVFPLVVYPFEDVAFACAVLMLVYACCHRGVQCFLRGFPWNTAYWATDRADAIREKAKRIAVRFGSSNRYLNPRISVREISLLKAVFVSGALLWWGHVLLWMDGGAVDSSFIRNVAIILAIVRIGMYWSLGARPPVGFVGRIRTGRWIIPKYDKVFIAPVCVVLVGTLGPLILESMMFPAWLSLRIVFFFVWFLVLWLPPSRRTWAYTGAHSFCCSRRA